MSKDIEKYTNWRTITESDYVTMFIKTWFAFVATLRELYPKENLDDVIGKGDNAFIKPYLLDFGNKFLAYNDLKQTLSNILRVYELGREFVLKNEKYNRFFLEDFFEFHNKFSSSIKTESYYINLQKKAGNVISVKTVFLDAEFDGEGKKLTLSIEYDYSDILEIKFNIIRANALIEDESLYIKEFSYWLYDKISIDFVGQFMSLKLKEKYGEKIFDKIQTLFIQEILQSIKSIIYKMQQSTVDNSEKLLYQLPISNFTYYAKNNIIDSTYDELVFKWFINFVYFMRNALFHEIIDPLDQFWQEIFKNSYLALKEILDGNIAYFIDLEKIKKLIYHEAWSEIVGKLDVYAPNFNENANNSDLEIIFVDYAIKNEKVEAKVQISFDYWYDQYTLKRVDSICRVMVAMSDWSFLKFKMEKIKDEIVSKD